MRGDKVWRFNYFSILGQLLYLIASRTITRYEISRLQVHCRDHVYRIGTVFESAYNNKTVFLQQALLYNPKVLMDALDYKELI